MKKNIKKNPIFSFIYKYRKILLTLLVFAVSFFLRAYDMDNKYPFGWDQVDYSWTAKNIIVNHEFPLVGMAVKQNTGFFIGPAYYYLVTFFYYLTDLNPIASHYVALVTNVFTFFVIFFIVKKLFSFRVALLACFINSIAAMGFYFDAVQWQVSFLPGISLIIFYSLYRILRGEEKYILLSALVTGIAFHTHFTAVFFPIIILLCFPFFPRTKKMIVYLLLSIPLGLVWFIPNIISQLQHSSQLSSLSNYLSDYYHGFHLRRFMQIIGDGFIQFDSFLYFQAIKYFKLLIIPVFLLVFLREKLSKERVIFSYLILLFFLVPWLVFSTYRGEISDYYFSINRFIALLILSYLLSKLLFVKRLLIKVIVMIFLAYYSYQNLNYIINYKDGGSLAERFGKVKPYVESGSRIEFQQGVPESYIYYYLMREKGVIVY